MGLVWERSRLFFICPVTGRAVPCGPPRPPHNGKGYLIKIPTAMVRALAPALQWGVIFLKVALASQGLGGILPIPTDWLPNQSTDDLSALTDLMMEGIGKDVKQYVEWEQKATKHDAVKQNALARVYKFIAEAEGNADDILNPAWIPQHTGLILTTAKTTGASLWVSKEGQQAFEERGWDAVHKIHAPPHNTPHRPPPSSALPNRLRALPPLIRGVSVNSPLPPLRVQTSLSHELNVEEFSGKK